MPIEIRGVQDDRSLRTRVSRQVTAALKLLSVAPVSAEAAFFDLAQAQEDGRAAPSDLEWVRVEVESLIAQAQSPDARGVALFACQALGLREMLPVHTAFDDAFVVGEAPYVRPLVAVAGAAAAAVPRVLWGVTKPKVKPEPEKDMP